MDVDVDTGGLEPLDFSPPDELIDQADPTLVGDAELVEPDAAMVGDGIIDPRTINPDPTGSAPSDDGEGDGDTDPGVVDPLGPHLTEDDLSSTVEPMESFDDFDGLAE